MWAASDDTPQLLGVVASIAGGRPDRYLTPRTTALTAPHHTPTVTGRLGCHRPARPFGFGKSVLHVLLRMSRPGHVSPVSNSVPALVAAIIAGLHHNRPATNSIFNMPRVQQTIMWATAADEATLGSLTRRLTRPPFRSNFFGSVPHHPQYSCYAIASASIDSQYAVTAPSSRSPNAFRNTLLHPSRQIRSNRVFCSPPASQSTRISFYSKPRIHFVRYYDAHQVHFDTGFRNTIEHRADRIAWRRFIHPARVTIVGITLLLETSSRIQAAGKTCLPAPSFRLK